MSADKNLQPLLSKLIVPAQNLTQLSFCGGNKETQLRQWLQQLPLTQAQQVSAPLYTAVHEISRLQTPWENRLHLLELLRIPIHQTLNGLARKYLNQPLILPEAALKTATVAQAIQKHFLNGYLAVVRDLCLKMRKSPEKAAQTPEMALSIQRALTALGLLLLRSYQLYLPISAQVWAEIHALYRIACGLGIEQQPVEENLPDHRGLKNIHHCYLQILLLATARPNQLRQEEIESTYRLLDLLAPAAELQGYNPAGKDNLFMVLLDGTSPPFYKSNWRVTDEPPASTDLMELRTTQLVLRLEDIYKATTPGADKSPLPTGVKLTAALTRHLEQAWSHLAMRSFARHEANTDIEITIGLTNIHFHLAGEQPFNGFLNQSSAVSDPPQKGTIYQQRGVQLKADAGKEVKDPWGDTFAIKGTIFDGEALPTINIDMELKAREKESYQGHHPIYTVPLVDRSLGGYGLEWRDEIPVQVRTGELLGLREYGRDKWAIGVVRWAHQTKGATQLGIQILAPHAIPAGLAAVHKTGGFAEYLRALLIPELKAINQPPSLIVNAVSFHEYTKARLYLPPQPGADHQGDLSVQLTSRLFATGAFSHFGYRELATTKPGEGKKDDLDSVWQ